MIGQQVPFVPTPTLEKRTTNDGLEVTCVYVDPNELTTVEAVLIDHLGRSQTLSVRLGTVLVAVPIGTLGDLPFDFANKRRDSDGRWVFHQRNFLLPQDVVSIASNAVQKNRSWIEIPKVAVGRG